MYGGHTRIETQHDQQFVTEQVGYDEFQQMPKIWHRSL